MKGEETVVDDDDDNDNDEHERQRKNFKMKLGQLSSEVELFLMMIVMKIAMIILMETMAVM